MPSLTEVLSKKFNAVLTIVVALISIVSAAIAYDKTLAKAEELEKAKTVQAQELQRVVEAHKIQLKEIREAGQRTRNRLDYKEAADAVYQLRERIWTIEDRHRTNMPTSIRDDLRILKEELNDLKVKKELLRQKPM